MSVLSLEIIQEKEIQVIFGMLPKRLKGGFEKFMTSLVVEVIAQWSREKLSNAMGLPIVWFDDTEIFDSKKKACLEKIIRCALLVCRRASMGKEIINEDLINFDAQSDTWDHVPVFRCYYNPEINLIADPEFLLLSWSKGLENFDTQQMSLLPALPRNPMTNVLLSPGQVRDVTEEVLLEWQIVGDRATKNVCKTRKQALHNLSEATPLLHALVYNHDGFLIYQCAYNIQKTLDKNLPFEETCRQCLLLYTTMIEKLQDEVLKDHLRVHNKLAVESAGMPHPIIKTGCLLTNYATYLFLYFPRRPSPDKLEDPSQNIFSCAVELLDIIDEIVALSNSNRKKLYVLDYNVKSKKLVYNAVPSLYHSKTSMQEICKKQGVSFQFLERNTQGFLYCNTVLQPPLEIDIDK